MDSADNAPHGATLVLERLDDDSAEWLRTLGSDDDAERDAAVARLHERLLRVAGHELRRRSGRLQIAGPELDDLAHQSAGDAVMGIVAKLEQFRGESRFVTWAYKFVVFEVSNKLGRHFWRNPTVALDAEDWERLPDRFGFQPAEESELRDLLTALRRAVEHVLTDHQRRVFVALVLQGIPLDALVVRLDSNRNAIYKTVFDARRKLRAALVADGYMNDKDANNA